MVINDYSKVAENIEEAVSRFDKFKSLDPFPNVAPALLNSSDFVDYAVTTGMVFPFDSTNKNHIKPASYEMGISKKVLYWDNKANRKYNSNLGNDETIIFRKNSITFVTVNAKFMLPDYIAIRFNLQIHHVHRGLLLGTGPLVDPGFQGDLMIPIHNLTENDYEIKVDEGLICVEFTKLSSNASWENNDETYKSIGEYVPNSKRKDNKTFLELIKKHVPHQKVRSSLFSTLAEAQEQTKKMRYLINGISIATLLVIIAILVPVYSLVSDVNKYVADSESHYMDQLNDYADEIVLEINKKDLEKLNAKYNQKISADTLEITMLRKQININNAELAKLQKTINLLSVEKAIIAPEEITNIQSKSKQQD